MRPLVILVTAIALWASSVMPAAAQSDADIVFLADALETDRAFVEQGASGATVVDVVEVLESVQADQGDIAGAIVLASPTDSRAADFALGVLEELDALRGSPIETVVVTTPDDVGLSSVIHDSVAQRDALDAATPGDPALQVIDDVLRALAPAAAVDDGSADDDAEVGQPAQAGESSSGGGGGAGLLLFLVVVAVIGVALFLFARGRGAAKRRENLETARAEAKTQLADEARRVYDLDARVELSDDDEIRRTFAEASVVFNELDERVDDVETGQELARLHADVDDLRWRLDVVEARLDGDPPPARPQPPSEDGSEDAPRDTDDRADGPFSQRDPVATCFFDPTHRAATRRAMVRSSRGEREVRVCRSCAQRLERGERPEPRMIDVAGRAMPAPRAPREYGGLAAALPSIFEVLLGGRGSDERERSEPVRFEWDDEEPVGGGPFRRRRSERTSTGPFRDRSGSHGRTEGPPSSGRLPSRGAAWGERLPSRRRKPTASGRRMKVG